MSIQSGRKDGAPSPSSVLGRAISVPHIRAAEDHEACDHGKGGNDEDDDEPTRHKGLRTGGVIARTCLGRRRPNRNPVARMEKPTICVFCGSSPGSDERYAQDARRLGALIAERGFNLLFGGGYVGLMGEVAHAAREGGAFVTGIIPGFLRHLEPPSHDAQRIVITGDLQERKRLMLSLSDGFAVLAGGLGTLDEFFEVITSVQLGVFDKPVVLVDTRGIFAPLDALLDHTVAQGFASKRIKAMYHRAPTPERAIEILAAGVTRPPPA
jgi:uncharacterized protein (TIGR00730 family)